MLLQFFSLLEAEKKCVAVLSELHIFYKNDFANVSTSEETLISVVIVS